jgi:hypothetical protein
MNVLDETARSATGRLRDAVHPDVETMLTSLHHRAARRRRRRAGLVAVAAAALVLVVAAVLLPEGSGSRADFPAGPTDSATGSPAPSASESAPVVLVRAEPLCELDGQMDSAYGEPLWTGRPTCPASTPAAEYASMVSGLNLMRPFTVRIPDGWEITMIPNGFWHVVEIRARDRSAGLTLVTYPAPMTAKGLESTPQLRRWLRRDPDLLLSGARDGSVGGWSAWRTDIALRSGAAVGLDCRLPPPCLPLLKPALKLSNDDPDAVAAELRPGVTGRLWLSEEVSVQFGVWLWDAGPGKQQDDARRVLASLRLFHPREPKQSSPPSPQR